MPEKPDKFEYKDVDIDDLVIDECNMSGGAWDHDKEIVRSVKEKGVINALDIRPSKLKGKYGIVAGTRRYNASIEAGLKSVPCKVHYSMSDTEAMELSFVENWHMKDRPEWLFIEWIGKIYEQMKFDMNFKGGMEDRYDILVRRTGLKRETISDYVKVCLYSPEELRAMMKPREDRTSHQKERLQGLLYRTESPKIILSLDKLKMILKELGDFPLRKQVEVADHVLTMKDRIALKIIKTVKINPKYSMWEIDDLIKKKPTGRAIRQISFDKKTSEALFRACERTQTKLPVLVQTIVKEWLKKNLYLASK